MAVSTRCGPHPKVTSGDADAVLDTELVSPEARAHLLDSYLTLLDLCSAPYGDGKLRGEGSHT